MRNTDADQPIFLKRIAYYNSAGTLVHEFLKTPVSVAPLAALELFVAESDNRGGSGACFLIEWLAEAPATEPVVEAVHANTLSGQGLVFTTWGRTLLPRSDAPTGPVASAERTRTPENPARP